MSIKKIFDHPLVYQWFQQAGGFFGARVKAIEAYLPMNPGDKILDVGCGPGFIVESLPEGVVYTGFDTDAKYIGYAQKRFGKRGEFVCGALDQAAAERYGPADIVMMNGVLHHLSDDEARETLGVIAKALCPGGRLFTLDGCDVEGQPAVSRYLLDHDRGPYVRTRSGYLGLIDDKFPFIEVHIESALSRVPYTFLIMVARKVL